MTDHPFQQIENTHLRFFKQQIGDQNVITAETALEDYSHDHTEDLSFPPEVVLKPADAKEISSIMQYCYEHNIAVTPRAAGTGLSGGALPVYGGIVLSVERLNSIIEIDERNLQVTTGPGVITQVLQEAVIEKGLFYPPDPASKGSCFIGGNIAENSGGPKAVKYGVVKDYVLNLEVVLPNGDMIWTGANVLKNATGYNLTQLMVGSEGTLGIVTKIVLKLIPFPRFDVSMLVPFFSATEACSAVSAIFRAGITPSGLEFMERDALDLTIKYVGKSNLHIADDVQAHLLIEVDGQDEEQLFRECEQIYEVLNAFSHGEIYFADTRKQKDELWVLRRKVGEAIKQYSIYKEEDTVVPRAELPALLKGVKAIGRKYGFRSVCFGHAGDGNMHVNILRENMADEQWHIGLKPAIRELFQLVKSLGGTISGEHGIGWVQREFMDIVFTQSEINLMKGIKQLFDPKGILNPGKIFPDIS